MISVMLDAMCRVSLKEKKLEDINERMFAKASERGRLAREITLDYLVFLGGGKSLERSQNTHSTASSNSRDIVKLPTQNGGGWPNDPPG